MILKIIRTEGKDGGATRCCQGTQYPPWEPWLRHWTPDHQPLDDATRECLSPTPFRMQLTPS